MKQTILLAAILVLAAVACNLPQIAPTPAIDSVISTDIPTPTISVPSAEAPGLTAAPMPFPGTPVSFDRISLTIPPGLAVGASGISQPAVSTSENTAPWDFTPGHVQLTLDGYALQDKYHQPRIYVYPAQEYAALQPHPAESIRRLREVIDHPTESWTNETLPSVPFFNAAQQFAAKIQLLKLSNAWGVRMLAQYSQYNAPVNNRELFYHFEGLTDDGKYYVIAILPLTAPILPANEMPDAAIPAGGVPLPDMNDPNADWQGYYNQVTQNLNALQPGDFMPSLEQLDLLIYSILIRSD